VCAVPSRAVVRERVRRTGGGPRTCCGVSKRPKPSSRSVSAQMSRMPRSDTGPELALRSALHRRGLRFRVNDRSLPGRPDIVLTRARVAVFVDGCFWHACPEHGVLPESNRDWWRAKLERNVERDREKDAALEELGWLTVHVWEHEDIPGAADVIEGLWSRRTGRT
jgi:DNA mismatch endonuclease, patch repair protein